MSKWFPQPTEPATHLQRRPKETFEECQRRTGIPLPGVEQERLFWRLKREEEQEQARLAKEELAAQGDE